MDYSDILIKSYLIFIGKRVALLFLVAVVIVVGIVILIIGFPIQKVTPKIRKH